MKSTLALVLATAAAVMAAPRPQETSVQIKASVFFTFTDASGVGNRDFQINVPVGASRLVEIDASSKSSRIHLLQFLLRRKRYASACAALRS